MNKEQLAKFSIAHTKQISDFFDKIEAKYPELRINGILMFSNMDSDYITTTCITSEFDDILLYQDLIEKSMRVLNQLMRAKIEKVGKQYLSDLIVASSTINASNEFMEDLNVALQSTGFQGSAPDCIDHLFTQVTELAIENARLEDENKSLRKTETL